MTKLRADIQQKPKVPGFCIDEDYSKDVTIGDEHDLEEWEPDPEHPYQEHDDSGQHGEGWDPEEMYKANEKLGFESSFRGIHEYSTSKPEGDEAARRRAHRIAAEIESNETSKKNAEIENWDEERDIKEPTPKSVDRKGMHGSKRQRDAQQKRDKKEDRSKMDKSGTWRRATPSSENKQQNKKHNNEQKDRQRSKSRGDVRAQQQEPASTSNEDYNKKFEMNVEAKEFVPGSTSNTSSSMQMQGFVPQNAYQQPQAYIPPVVPHGYQPQPSPIYMPYHHVMQIPSFYPMQPQPYFVQQNPGYSAAGHYIPQVQALNYPVHPQQMYMQQVPHQQLPQVPHQQAPQMYPQYQQQQQQEWQNPKPHPRS